MGIVESIRRRSSSFKGPGLLPPHQQVTRQGILLLLLQYPNTTSTPSTGEPNCSQSMDLGLARIKSNFSSLSIKLKSHKRLDLNLNQDQDQKKKCGPEGFRSFVQNAKDQNPNYRKEKLKIMKPVSSKDGFGWLMNRKRNDWVDE
nr:uncharacterized protein I203_03385 [Kwoniella mangroviensis CBS 8507]OCF67687.1 hypothetical protein I203_03385 [Kwoniella mangroviensis CBS 8507]